MLEPQTRRLLFDALRPPAGMRLDAAIGTSYSLDLLALLTAPLAFTLFDWQDRDGGLVADPLAIFEALRRNADRIALFCQAGGIHVPRSDVKLLSYLEGSVFEARAPAEGYLFHPKLWLLRFSADEEVAYRFVCSSRNLTFDRSWDTMVVLEGVLRDRRRAIRANNPLGDFVAALPSMALRPLPERVLEAVELFQDELRRVRFEPPEGFDSVAFWPLGLPDESRWPFEGRVGRLLVVSPFLTPSLLERLAEQGREPTLVSRDEALQGLEASTLEYFSQVYTLSETADTEEEDQEDTEATAEDATLTGLHAKLYVADAGSRARLWTGSANATAAAFGGNVEFLVELEGSKRVTGVDAVLGTEDGAVGLGSLLEQFVPPEEAKPPDPDLERLERLLDRATRELWSSKLAVKVEGLDKESFRLALTAETDAPGFKWGVQAKVWPVTLPDGQGQPIVKGPWPVFEPLSFEAMTSFFAFELTAKLKSKSQSTRFVLNLPLLGAPGDRRERVLRWLLSDSEGVMRLLMLILAEGGGGGGIDPGGLLGPGGSWNGRATGDERQLFESLVRTLGRSPERLDEVAKLVKELSRDENSRRLLPRGFEEIWEPIWAARTRLQS